MEAVAVLHMPQAHFEVVLLLLLISPLLNLIVKSGEEGRRKAHGVIGEYGVVTLVWQ